MAEISFYFDEYMSRKVASQLIERGYRVVMAVDEDMVGKDDLSEHLQFASERGLVMVTCERPFAGRAMTQPQTHGSGVLDRSFRRLRWSGQAITGIC